MVVLVNVAAPPVFVIVYGALAEVYAVPTVRETEAELALFTKRIGAVTALAGEDAEPDELVAVTTTW
jgi:hypothetical protein